MINTADVNGGKSIAISSQSISGVNAINPLVAFYDRKRKTTKEREMCYFFLSWTPHETYTIIIIIDISTYVNKLTTIKTFSTIL
jgi:hypothetical protein